MSCTTDPRQKKKQVSSPCYQQDTGFKKLLRGVARKGHGTIARQVLANSKTRTYVISSLKKYIQKEMTMTVLCSKKEKSLLRERSVESGIRWPKR